ncbi:hypothetical protein PVAND_014606 [Polypedilum vanderplanki]|uniref:Uncharacterized protein n=1 Tax=Polypedilum vanderplanki TaxID=319348 RepID=A0A9J6B9V7_POLVA|nr:hypothetical protein PVAND_014606 [Polypedilum vanderplanki]
MVILTIVRMSFLQAFYEQKFFIGIKFPFETSNDFAYFGLHLWIIFAGSTLNVILLLTEGFTYGLIVVLIIEFRKLRETFVQIKEKIEEIAKLKKEHFKKRDKENEKFHDIQTKINDLDAQLKLQLQQLLIDHSSLLEIRHDLQKIFSKVFLVNFFTTTFSVCFESFNTITSPDIASFLTNFFGSVCQSWMLFIQCRFSELVKNESFAVAKNAYFCNWEEIESVEIKKKILIILMRSQKSAAFTNWKFSEVSLEQFSKFVTSTYSYFALLRQIYEVQHN